MNAPVIVTTSLPPTALQAPTTTAPARPAQPTLVDAVVGRIIELVVQSVEGARDRVRGRHAVH